MTYDLRRRVIVGFVSLIVPLFAITASWADPSDPAAVDCQTYQQVASFQRQIALGLGHTVSGIGTGCEGAEGPRWSEDKGQYFTWCQSATPEERDAETQARRQFLLACTAKKAGIKAPEWDETSCSNFSGGMMCGHSANAEGEGRCNADGNQIMGSVDKIRKDPSLLFDHNRDQGLNQSGYYHHFSKWNSFRCQLRPGHSGNEYGLIGYTGDRGRVSKPKYPMSTTLPPTDKVPKPSDAMRKKLF
jgi:hypothetical protein